MSADEHRHHHAQVGALKTRVLVVSSTRSLATDTGGALCEERLIDEGHEVQRDVVGDDAAAIHDYLVTALSEGVDVVICTGGTGLARRDVTAETVDNFVERAIPGFGELFRVLSFQQIGAAALLSRATAGTIGGMVVFALPGSEAGCATAMDLLVTPELTHLIGELRKDGPGLYSPRAVPMPAVAERTEEVDAEVGDDVVDETAAPEPAPDLPPPSGSLGRIGGRSLSLRASEDMGQEPVAGAGGEVLQGWKRAVYEVRGELTHGKWHDLPPALERVAPVVDVLHHAGERGVMTLPSGREYLLFGYPDLQRPGSRVLAVGVGDATGEILALHRYPVLSGLLAEDTGGLLPHRARYSVEGLCEAVTGSSPRRATGTVTALDGEAVWYERDGKVYHWDGGREHEDGTANQALATSILHWSNR